MKLEFFKLRSLYLLLFTVLTSVQCKDDAVVHQQRLLNFKLSSITANPTIALTQKPTSVPSQLPTRPPSSIPSNLPSKSPTPYPTHPTAIPSAIPSFPPSIKPTRKPSFSPSHGPTMQPFAIPSPYPTQSPSIKLSVAPTHCPSLSPSKLPSQSPTTKPTPVPSVHPTQPSALPTSIPTLIPTNSPSGHPTKIPTSTPTYSSTLDPTQKPSLRPSAAPSAPTISPSVSPSHAPSQQPSKIPTTNPSLSPTSIPSSTPSQPSPIPTGTPTNIPSIIPSFVPSASPTTVTTSKPTVISTSVPTLTPSFHPSQLPSTTNTARPSGNPTGMPTHCPTTAIPSHHPSIAPSIQNYSTIEFNFTIILKSLTSYHGNLSSIEESVIVSSIANVTNTLVTYYTVAGYNTSNTQRRILSSGNDQSTLYVIIHSIIPLVNYYPTLNGSAIFHEIIHLLTQSTMDNSLTDVIQYYARSLKALLLMNATADTPPIDISHHVWVIPPPIITNTPTAHPSRLSIISLMSFDFNYGTGQMKLYFDDLVAAKTFDIHKISLQSEPNDTLSNAFQFTSPGTFNDLSKQGNTSTLIIYMSSNDYARLKLSTTFIQNLCTSSQTTYLSMASTAVYSPFGQGNIEISNQAALPVSSYTYDNYPPYVESFTLDMNLDFFTITFTEPIALETFHFYGLAIQATGYLLDNSIIVDSVVVDKSHLPSGSLYSVTSIGQDGLQLNNYGYSSPLYYELVDELTTFIEIKNLNRTLVYKLGEFNLNAIKEQLGLAVSLETAYLSGWRPFVNDTSGNPVSMYAFDRLNALRAMHYDRDVIPPTLLHWELNMDSGNMSMIFSETVYVSFLKVSGIILTNQNRSDHDSVYLRVSAPMTITTVNGPIVHITFNNDQLNLIKGSNKLAKTVDDSYLILDPHVVVDTSLAQNPYAGLDATMSHPRIVTRYFPDVSPPYIIGFELDLSNRTMTFIFSEIVNIQSVHLQSVTLQSKSIAGIGAESFQFTTDSATLLTTTDSTIVNYLLSDQTYNLIRNSPTLAISKESSYISVTRYFAKDKAQIPNRVLEIYPALGFEATSFIPDSTRPELISWYIDLSTNQLILTLSKLVNIETLQLADISLSSDPTPFLLNTVVVQLTSSSYVLSSNLNVVTIQLSSKDTESIKSQPPLCLSHLNCFISFTSNFVNDTTSYSESGQSVHYTVSPVDSFPCCTGYSLLNDSLLLTIIPDTSPAKLLNFSLDMNLKQLLFTFSKSMNALALNATGIRLLNQNHYQNNVSKIVDLSSNSFGIVSNSNVFAVNLSYTDYINIKLAAPLGTNTLNTFLYMESFTASDTNSNLPITNEYVFNESTKALMASSITLDSVQPAAISIYINFVQNQVLVFFNDVVDIRNVIPAGFILVSRSGNKVSLAGGNLLTAKNSNVLKFDLVPIMSELNQYDITSQINSFFYIAFAGAVRDALTPTILGQSISSSNPIRDGLVVLDFRLNLIKGFIILEFPYLVDIIKLDPTLISLIASDQSSTYSLTGYNSLVINTKLLTIQLQFTETDFQTILETFVITSESFIYMSINVNAIKDVNGKVLSSSQSVPCIQVVADDSAVAILSVNLDMNIGVLSILFSKAIVFSRTLLDGTLYLATADSPYSSTSPICLEFHGHGYYCQNLNKTSNYKVVGLSGLSILNLPPTLQPTSRSAVLKLSLNGFSNYTNNYFDYNDDSKFISNTMLNYYGVKSNGTNEYQITARDIIHQNYPLASSTQTSYLSVTPGFVFDSSQPPNPLNPISIGAALEVSSVVLDTTAPTLLSFDLYLNTRHLVLHFSETIKIKSLIITYFTLLQTPIKPTSAHYTLTTSSTIQTLSNSANVTILISAEDMNAMLAFAPNLITKPDTTHISILNSAVQDLATPPNPIADLYFRYGQIVSNYSADTIPPHLLQYNLSIENGWVDFIFNEVINCSATNVQGITFQSGKFVGKSSAAQLYRLTEGISYPDCVYYPPYSIYLRVRIGIEDIFGIKSQKFLSSSKFTKFITIDQLTFFDSFMNAMALIVDGNALQCHSFFPDVVSPNLLSFDLTSNLVMVLVFDEPVDATTFKPQGFILQNGVPANTKNYPFVFAKVTRTAYYSTRLYLSFHDDFQRIAADDSLVFRNQFSTFLRANPIAISDTSGNMLTTISAANAILFGPTVLYWDLNLNNGLITLYYSDIVNTNFPSVGFSFQSEVNRSMNQLSIPLTTDTFFQPLNTSSQTHVNSPLNIVTFRDDQPGAGYSLFLNNHDLIQLKLSGFISLMNSAEQSLYLSCRPNLTKALLPHDILPYSSSTIIRIDQARKLRKFIPDTESPYCQSFQLNLNSGSLIITFDEPILPTSLDLTKVTLLYSQNNGSFVTLLSQPDVHDNTTLFNSSALHIRLSSDNLNNIKLAFSRGGLQLNQLLLSYGAVSDIYGNLYLGNDANNPIPLVALTLDTSPPKLLYWQFDLSSGLITLTFDEHIDISISNIDGKSNTENNHQEMEKVLSIEQIYLTSTSYFNRNISMESIEYYPVVTHQLQLSAYSLLQYDTTSSNNIIINMNVLAVDMFRIEGSQHIAKNISSTFITIFNLSDIFGNRDTITPYQTERTSELILPANNVVLESFDFAPSSQHPGYYEFDLYFSRSMDIANFSCSDFTFVGSRGSLSNGAVQLTSNECILINPTATSTQSAKISFIVLENNFFSTLIGQSVTSTYLTIPTTGRSIDIYGNNLASISLSSAMGVGPQLIQSVLDMNLGRLIFVFSKPVNFSALNSTSHIGLYSSLSSESYLLPPNEQYLSLQSWLELNEIVTTKNETVGVLQLQDIDLDHIKLLQIAPSSTYLLIDAPTITDSNGFGLAFRSYENMLQITEIIPDTTQPMVLSIGLDMGLGEVTLNFTEPMKLSSITVTKFRIQASRSIPYLTNTVEPLGGLSPFYDSSSFYQLTTGSVTTSLNSVIIRVGSYDMSIIKLSNHIAKSLSSSFLSYNFDSGLDMAGNPVDSVSYMNALPFNQYIEDQVSPVLVQFSVDLSGSPSMISMTLYFSEPMDLSTFNISNVFVQSRYFARDGSQYRLTGCEIISNQTQVGFGQVIKILLNSHDVSEIKSTPGLFRSKQSSYLIFDGNFISDISGNPIQPYYDGFALSASTYVLDQTSPVIVSTSLNMTAGTLQLFMSEPVNLTAIDVTGISLFAAPSSNISFQLTYSSVVSQLTPLSDAVLIIFSSHDLNAIKCTYPIGTASGNTWFSISPILLQDSSFNRIQSISSQNPLPLATFASDTILPYVISTIVDMNNAMISFEFNECVLSQFFNSSQLNIQSTPARRFGSLLNLNDTLIQFGSLSQSTNVQLLLTPTASSVTTRFYPQDFLIYAVNINYLKYYGVALSVDTAYFSWSNIFMSDYAGNLILPHWDDSVTGYLPPIEANYVSPDTTAPTLLRWYIQYPANPSVDLLQLYVFFDEPVMIPTSSPLTIQSNTQLNRLNVSTAYFDVQLSLSKNTLYTPSAAGTASPVSIVKTFNDSSAARISSYSIQTSYESRSNQSHSVQQDFTTLSSPIASIEYSEYGCNLIVNIQDYCLEGTTLMQIGSNSSITECSDPHSNTLYQFLNQSTAASVLLTMGYGSVMDVADPPNPIEMISAAAAIPEGASDCSLCPTGYFTANNCTSVSDRVCKPCTTCSLGRYAQSSCSSYHDTSCSVCSTCKFGTYVAGSCNGTYDTQCATCTRCGEMEYSVRDCALGLNTLCESCQVCKFPTQKAQNICKSLTFSAGVWAGNVNKYQDWFNMNCCTDGLGNKFKCEDQQLNNFKLQAKSNPQISFR